MDKTKYLNDVISQYEAEEIIKNLKELSIDNYCSKEMIKKYSIYEKLNMQSHKNSLLGGDDYILNAFVLEDKLKDLIKDLFVVHLFRIKIYPKINKQIIEYSSLKTYLCLFFESIVVNLLEKFFFYVTACQGAEEYIIDIIEFCYFKITSVLLNSKKQHLIKNIIVEKHDKDLVKIKQKIINTKKNSNEKLSESEIEEIKNSINNISFDKEKDIENKVISIDFNVSMACLSIIRYITDHLGNLSFPVTNYLLNSKDVPLLLVELIDKKPWELKNKETGEVTHVFSDNIWHDISEENIKKNPNTKEKKIKLLSELNKYEGQLWIAVYNLFLVEGNKYEITDYRKNVILGLKKHMNQRLYDILPPLVNLYRSLEELSISGNNSNSSTTTNSNIYSNMNSSSKSFVVEQIPVLYMSVHSNNKNNIYNNEDNIKTISESIVTKYFKNANINEEMKLVSELYTNENLNYFMDTPICGNCGKEATNRCSQCKSEWYCSKECQISRWKGGHKEFCKKMKELNDYNNKTAQLNN